MRFGILSLATLLSLPISAALRADDIVLIGKASIPGTESDKSGLKDVLKDGIPHNRLGGIGSAIAWTGQGNRYLMLPDRGPLDGAVNYFCRYHALDITIQPNATPPVKAVLQTTTMLKSSTGKPLSGQAAPPDGLQRFDPEGLVVLKNGNLIVSEEYGPLIVEFSPKGEWLRSFEIPKKFPIAKPSGDPDEEVRNNSTGRAPNGGFEGLSITPQGDKLFAILEKVLLQDGGPREMKSATGKNARILELPVGKGTTREYVYPLEAASHRLNEILAVNEHQFLVIERDSLAGEDAKFKMLFLIDLQDATDISGLEALGDKPLPANVRPVTKKPFLNLLAPSFNLAGKTFPAKIEGLTFGPLLEDGRLLLLVTSDNDFKADEPSWILAFAIDRKALPGWKPRDFGK